MTSTIELDGRTIRLDAGSERGATLRCGDDEMRAPDVRTWAVIDGGIVLIIEQGDSRGDKAFTITRSERNVVCVDPDLELRWIVDTDEDHAETVDGYAHRQFFRLGDRLITRADSRRFFEIDPATGAIEDSWPADAFVIGSERHELKYPVAHVATVGDRRIVAANGPEFGSVVYAFDGNGTELWQRGFGEELLGLTASGDSVTAVRRRARNAVLDAETGDLVE